MTNPPTHAPFPEEPTTPLPAAHTGPHAAANDSEEVYYAGSPLLRGELGRGMIWIVVGLLFLAAPIVWQILAKPGHGLIWWVWLILIGLGLIFILVPYLKARSIRYRITNYRVDVTRGLLGRNIDTVELWHVEDIRFHQSLGARLAGIGDITVISKHPTIPVLVMRSLPQARQLFTELEQRIIAVKRLSGVVKVDPGT